MLFLSGSWINSLQFTKTARIAILYSYYEKDIIQRENFRFFLIVGYHPFRHRSDVDYYFTINGNTCTICSKDFQESANTYILYYEENKGMDFGSWGQALQRIKVEDKWTTYSYFLFINSSTRGPYLPKYFMEAPWWHAYTALMTDMVVAVGSSLVCLPDIDLGGPGPRIESWAFALTVEATRLLESKGVFSAHADKFGR